MAGPTNLGDEDIRKIISENLAESISRSIDFVGHDNTDYVEYLMFSILGGIIIRERGLDKFKTYTLKVIKVSETK